MTNGLDSTDRIASSTCQQLVSKEGLEGDEGKVAVQDRHGSIRGFNGSFQVGRAGARVG